MNGPNLVEELRRMPDDVVSFHKVVEDVRYFLQTGPTFDLLTLQKIVQLKYTFGPGEPIHNELIGNTLTRALGSLLPDIQDEIVSSLNDLMPATDSE